MRKAFLSIKLDKMGSNITTLNDENISQTQLATINENCKQTATASIDEVTITAINSHIGDISLSADLKVGNLSCVMDAVASSSVDASVANATNAAIASLPFQFDANSVYTQNTVIISSFQQSMINQSCIQRTAAEATNITLTFIDSSTGNIKIGAQADISSLACNIQASSYQSATASVKDDTTAKVSTGCCIFDLGMLLPMALGLVGLVVLSKYMNKKSNQSVAGAGTSEQQDKENLIENLAQLTYGPGPSGDPVRRLPESRQGVSSGGARTFPNGTSTQMTSVSQSNQGVPFGGKRRSLVNGAGGEEMGVFAS